MQTFLPYPDFRASARVLDRQRLGKQRVEAWQIIKALTGQTRGWVNHPASLMWDGYIAALSLYAIAVCEEWISRGYKDTMLPRFVAIAEQDDFAILPPWLGDESFHASHRSNLLRKAPEWYRQFDWTESEDLPYVWPSK